MASEVTYVASSLLLEFLGGEKDRAKIFSEVTIKDRIMRSVYHWKVIMAETELSVLKKQCLNRRIPDMGTLTKEVACWNQDRNQCASTIRWRFTTADARIKLAKLYPSYYEK